MNLERVFEKDQIEFDNDDDDQDNPIGNNKLFPCIKELDSETFNQQYATYTRDELLALLKTVMAENEQLKKDEHMDDNEVSIIDGSMDNINTFRPRSR